MVVAAMMACASAHAQQGSFEYKCRDTGRNSQQCTVRNSGQAELELCVDVVKVCKGGDHVATLCTGMMKPGEVTSKVLPAFYPKVKLLESCMGTEFRNQRANQQVQ